MIEDLTNNLNNFDTTILKLITLYNSQFKSIKIDHSNNVIDRSVKHEIVFKDTDLELIKEILQQSVVVSLKNENSSPPPTTAIAKSSKTSSLATSLQKTTLSSSSSSTTSSTSVGGPTANPTPPKRQTTATSTTTAVSPTPVNNSNNYDYLFKFILLGDTNVGKSGMLYYYAEDCLDSGQNRYTTCGIDFKIHRIELDGKIIKEQIWDVDGKNIKFVSPNYVNGNVGALLVYDVADERSFNSIKDWLALLNNNSHTGSKILVGNKCDLQKRVIDYERGRAMADDLGIPFIETSAVTGTGIKEAFTLLAKSTLIRTIQKPLPSSVTPKALGNTNSVQWSPYNNIVTQFSLWNKTLLTEFIQHSHDRGVAVHNMIQFNCNVIDCNYYFNNGQYIGNVTLLAQVGGDGLHLDIEKFGNTQASTFKGWANTAFQYLKSVNSKYVSSMAVGCGANSGPFYNADWSDYFILMCYDMGWSSNPLAPTSPIKPVRDNVNNWKPYVNTSAKIIMALPLFSYYADCLPMDYGLFGTTCNVDGVNNNPSIGYNGIYNLVNNYPVVSYQELNGVAFANVLLTSNIRQYMYDTPATLYRKYNGMGIGGTACWRIDNLVGLPSALISAFYTALYPNN
ncbi:hypothetical protein PPL_08361 [Heterostelium album PN500]|uniref:Uncharacterized protein n=1 Tax=Heterostelium pallidum (strain ATCC 26659 / Pp 5 / PN500) TaxID=670386 RepID=D3BHZ3_HETP5|nr:hypothetical protein PPL_08361 [Heterostelium album PN500]EFA78893.1 hypothetical protein PPL_08361 [Heterostelium album PN500]|eukprot:XP_020431017.1 hypothetical protein PPL_08361 [Heterostelium album PN500]